MEEEEQVVEAMLWQVLQRWAAAPRVSEREITDGDIVDMARRLNLLVAFGPTIEGLTIGIPLRKDRLTFYRLAALHALLVLFSTAVPG